MYDSQILATDRSLFISAGCTFFSATFITNTVFRQYRMAFSHVQAINIVNPRLHLLFSICIFKNRILLCHKADSEDIPLSCSCPDIIGHMVVHDSLLIFYYEAYRHATHTFAITSNLSLEKRHYLWMQSTRIFRILLIWLTKKSVKFAFINWEEQNDTVELLSYVGIASALCNIQWMILT